MHKTLMLVAPLAAATCLAHEGARFWLGIENGQVLTYASDNDLDPTAYAPSRLFATELESLFTIWTTEFPGFEVRQDGGNVPSEATFGFDLGGPLLFYDPSAGQFVAAATHFATPGPVPQMAVSLSASLRVTASGPVAGFDFFNYFGQGDHSHLSFTLLGDGVAPVDGPAGVYALQLVVGSDVASDSPPFWLLIGKQVAIGDLLFEEALAEAQQSLIPGEPCPGDADDDQDVDLDDLLLVLGNFGCGGPCAAGTVDADGDVDLDDLLLVLGGLGQPCD